MKGIGRLPVLLFLLPSLAACAHRGPLLAPLLDGGAGRSVEIAGLPFFPQEERQCGPAALATVLAGAGAETTPEALAGEVYLPGRGGSLQIEMAAAVRRRGLVPSPLRPDLSALLSELSAGRPVLVLLNLGLAGVPLWHYAVVTGFDAARDAVVLRSGRERRKVTGAALFDRTWRASGRWGFAVLRPGEVPAAASREGYLRAAAALEEGGRPEAAEEAYGAALEAWPGDETALLGIGNARARQGDWPGAAEVFRALVEARPASVAGRNNLAHALMEAGDLEGARVEIGKVIAAARRGGEVPAYLEETEAEILRRSGPAGPSMAPALPRAGDPSR